MKFNTDRLAVENLTEILTDPSGRQVLERELESVLTSNVTRYLPLSMQFSGGQESISKWIDARVNEAQILCVHSQDARSLVGLIILAEDPEPSDILTIHLGYFLGEKDWGKGYATEILTGLVANFENETGVRLLAGVDSDNVASARVLEKSGFTKSREQSADGQTFFEIVIT